jgi:hypothetical protein
VTITNKHKPALIGIPEPLHLMRQSLLQRCITSHRHHHTRLVQAQALADRVGEVSLAAVAAAEVAVAGKTATIFICEFLNA